MKPVFGLLLVGGGLVLMVGLFTGKITFPLGTTTNSTSSSQTSSTSTSSNSSPVPINQVDYTNMPPPTIGTKQ